MIFFSAVDADSEKIAMNEPTVYVGPYVLPARSKFQISELYHAVFRELASF